MKKRLNLLTALLLAVVMTLCLIPGAAAAEPEEGERPLLTTVDPDTFSGTITVNLEYNKNPVSGIEVTLYQVGTGTIVNNNLVFALADALAGEEPLELNGLKAADVKAAIKELMDRLGDLSKEERAELVVGAKDSDKDGKIVFDGLEIGVYLAVKTERGSDYLFDPTLVFMPYGKETGWDDDMPANPKISYDFDDDPEPPPTNIPDNPPPGGGKDPDPDPGEEIPDEDVPLAVLPQTGLLQWPIPVMAAAGLLLVAVGLLSERKRRAGN